MANYWVYKTPMTSRFDKDKDAANIEKHGISLSRVSDFIEVAVMVDDRFDYGEVRYRAWGYIDGEPHFLAFTFRDDEMRPISLRRAHAKEMRRYVKKT